MALARNQITLIDVNDGYVGGDGKSYVLNILGGQRSVVYDQDGTGYSPAPTSFTAELVVDGVVTPPTTYAWSAQGHLSGTGNGANFTPSYAASFNNSLSVGDAVFLTVTYNGMTIRNAAPIAVSKIGTNGVPTYTWIRYADAIDGTGINNDPAGKAYIGFAHNKLSPTESNLPGDYTWSLVKGPQGDPGNDGDPAKTLSFVATTQILKSPFTGGATTPVSTTVTAELVNTTGVTWTYSSNGGSFSATRPNGVGIPSGNSVVITGESMVANTITIKGTSNGASDTITIAKVVDGEKGITGDEGPEGPKGDDAYTVILSNENHAFPGTISAAIAGSTFFDIIAYKGATRVGATVGTITGTTANVITTAITNNGATNVRVTVNVTTSLTSGGILTIPITVDGKVFTKIFTYTIAFKGTTGKGVTSSEIRYQAHTSGTSIPSGTWELNIPTVSPDQYLWTRTVLTYSEGSPTTSYSVGRMGKDGLNGADGSDGADGRGVASTSLDYQTSSSGTSIPSTWQGGIPTVPQGHFLWTRVTFNYTTGLPTYSYSVARAGTDGAPAKLVKINASATIFKSADGGATFNPATIVLTPTLQGGVTYSNWQVSTNGGSTWVTAAEQNGVTIASGVLTLAKTSTLFTVSITSLVFKVNTSDAAVSDTITISKLYDVVDLGQQAIFDKLTGGGVNEGLFLSDGKVYINGTYIRTGNLVAGNAMIQNGYLNTAVIQDGTIATAKIGDAQITNAKIANLAITNAKIADATIESAKIASLNAGKITTGIIKDALNKNSINMDNGTFTLGGGKIAYNGSSLTIDVDNLSISGSAAATKTYAEGYTNTQLNNLAMGGTNLWLKSSVDSSYDYWNPGDGVKSIDTGFLWNGRPTLKFVKGSASAGGLNNVSVRSGLPANTEFVCSFMAHSTIATPINSSSLGHMQVVGTSDLGNLHRETSMSYYPSTLPANTWTKVSITFKTPVEAVAGETFTFRSYLWYLVNGATYHFADFQLEKGNKATDWAPAPEDKTDNTQTAIFNTLTNNGATQGIYLSSGKLYINGSYIQAGAINANLITAGTLSADRIQGGTLTMGGASNGNGLVLIKDTSNRQVMKLDKDGLIIDMFYNAQGEPTNQFLIRDGVSKAELLKIGASGELYYSGVATFNELFLDSTLYLWSDLNAWGNTIVNNSGNLGVQDTRSSNMSTNLGDKGVRFDFKSNAAQGLNDGGTYHSTMTIQPWVDGSGGNIAQLAFTSNGNMWLRSTPIGGTWPDWKKVSLSDESIVASGSNANGRYLRFGDGTLICWAERTFSTTIALGWGSLFYHAVQSWSFPYAFVGAKPVCSATYTDSSAELTGMVPSSTLTNMTFYGMRPTSVAASTSLTARMMAIGRWK